MRRIPTYTSILSMLEEKWFTLVVIMFLVALAEQFS